MCLVTDVNKDTKEVPKVRSRLVGEEFAHGERRDEDLYAPTPSLAAARFLLSTCASQGKRGPGHHRIKAMYGTRDAPALERTMIKLEFRPVVSTLACIVIRRSMSVLLDMWKM